MAFAQLTWRESLRDGHILPDVAALLIPRAGKLYSDTDLVGLDLMNTVYALDATTINLYLSLFEWAPYRKANASVKLHTLLNLRAGIPAFIHINDGKMHEVNVLVFLPIEAGAFYVMDRGYLDFMRLYALHRAGEFFVTRTKVNMKARRIYSKASDRTTGVICDQTVLLNGFYASKHYPENLSRTRFKDPETGKTLIFLTNNFLLPSLTTAVLYKKRWQIELFFKWIKQHLRIKKFLGNSENAVKTQIWCAVSTYVLTAIVKKELQIDASLYTLLQIFGVGL
jgi:IS4 transposase